MTLQTFDDLLQAARQQPQAQHLLLVFAVAELPEGSTPAQAAAFHAGQGGALVPAFCVDKAAAELASFAALCAEAAGLGAPWQMLFASTLSGLDGQAASNKTVDAALQRMVELVKTGQLDAMVAFNPAGEAVQLG